MDRIASSWPITLWLLALLTIEQNLKTQHYSEIFKAETDAIVNRIKGSLQRIQHYC